MDTITDIILLPANLTIDLLDGVADLLPKAAMTIIPTAFLMAVGMGWFL